MAYADTSLVLLGSAPYGTSIDKARSVYLYPTADDVATAIAAGYFNNARTRLVKGDIVHIVSSQDGTPALKTVVVSASPSSGNVTVASGGTISALTPLTTSVGTASDTIPDVGATFNQATLNNIVKSLATKINAIIAS